MRWMDAVREDEAGVVEEGTGELECAVATLNGGVPKEHEKNIKFLIRKDYELYHLLHCYEVTLAR